MPRKHRIYGSVESLDRRYRDINELIRGLHRQLGAEPTAEEVIAYGRDMGLEMPGTFDDTSRIPTTSPQTATTKRPRSVSAAALLSPVSPDTKTARPSDRRSSDESVDLVRDPSGRPHYIGPAGSMAFFTRLRNLVATRSKSATSALGGDTYSIAEEHDKSKDPTVKFPEREVADRYIEAFFKHVHPNSVLFHRPTFQHVYEEMWRTATASTTEPARGVERSAQEAQQPPAAGSRSDLERILESLL
ncbi:transcriptional regulatory protein [Apiospora marii]|uniref:transcriptional regulatory protein n=1 Tax=Apiospora marii TaxID=335849 RepID=UPI003131A477